MPKANVLNRLKNPRKKILFLGYDKNQTKLLQILIDANCEMHQTNGVFNDINYDLIISFGYKHILKPDFLRRIKCPIINLHISFLPFNRGAHPNFWSFYDGTPAGVTIHMIDEGIDTGSILFQKLIAFDNERTFAETHARLKSEIELLFLENLDVILDEQWTPRPQIGEGTYHSIKDLPLDFAGWDAEISTEIRRLHMMLGQQ